MLSFFFFYLLTPIRVIGNIVIPKQLDVLVVSSGITSIFFLCIVIHQIRTRQKAIRLTIVDIIFIAYAFYLVSHDLKRISLQEQLQLITLILFYIILRNIHKRFLSVFGIVLIFSGITQIVFGIIDQTVFFLPGKNLSDISGIFPNTGIWGGFVSIVIITLIGIVLNVKYNKENRYIKWLLCVLIVLFLIFLIASNSRAAWVSFFGAIVYLIFNRVKIKYRYKLLLVLLIFPILLNGLYHYKKDSADGRILIWTVSANMIKDRPILGYGLDGFEKHYMRYQANYFKENEHSRYKMLADNNHYAFNEFLRIFVEQGILGLVLFLLLTLSALTSIFEKEQKTSNIVKSLLITLLFFSLFSYPLSFIEYELLFVSLLAVISRFKSPIIVYKLNLVSGLFRYSYFFSIIGIIVFCSLNLSFYIKKVNPYFREYSLWNASLKNYKVHDIALLSNLDSNYSILGENADFLYSYGKILNREKKFKKASIILKQAENQRSSYYTLIELGEAYKGIGEINKAIACWDTAVLMIPSRLKPKFLIAQLHYNQEDVATANKIFEELRRMRPKKYTPEYIKTLNEIETMYSGVE